MGMVDRFKGERRDTYEYIVLQVYIVQRYLQIIIDMQKQSNLPAPSN